MTRLWHITISTISREAAFRTELERRDGVRRVVGIAGDSLALFGLVDDHLHNAARVDRTAAGRLAQRISCSLQASCGLRFEMSDIRPINGRLHLRTLVRYILTQPKHHDIPLHPALWEGSCFQDLVGARWLAAPDLILRQELPRLSVNEVMDIVGLPPSSIIPADPQALRELGLTRIASCAATAVGAGSLTGQRPETLVARRVTVRLARAAGFSPAEICAATGWPARTVSRYAKSDVAPGALRATRIRMSLVRAVAVHSPTSQVKRLAHSGPTPPSPSRIPRGPFLNAPLANTHRAGRGAPEDSWPIGNARPTGGTIAR